MPFLLEVNTVGGKKIKETKGRKRREQAKKRKEDLEEEIHPDTYLVSFFSCELSMT